MIDFLHGFDERLSLRGDDGIAVTAQSSHSGGRPINQRGCAGFNWPPLVIPAEEPVSISPVAVRRAGWSFFTFQTTLPRSPFSGAVPSLAPSLWSLVVGVGQPVLPLSEVRCADATSWEYDLPAGVVFSLQVRRYNVEPSGSSFVRNLLAKDDVRAALLDEPVEGWP